MIVSFEILFSHVLYCFKIPVATSLLNIDLGPVVGTILHHTTHVLLAGRTLDLAIVMLDSATNDPD